jgi:hypothetical protein
MGNSKIETFADSTSVITFTPLRKSEWRWVNKKRRWYLFRNWELIDSATTFSNFQPIEWNLYYIANDADSDKLRKIKCNWIEKVITENEIEEFVISNDLQSLAYVVAENDAYNWFSTSTYKVFFKWKEYLLEENKFLSIKQFYLTQNWEHFFISWMDENASRDDIRNVFMTDKISKKEWKYFYWINNTLSENWKLFWINSNPDWKYWINTNVFSFEWDEIYEFFKKEGDPYASNKTDGKITSHNFLGEVYSIWWIPNDDEYISWVENYKVYDTYISMNGTIFQHIFESWTWTINQTEFRFKRLNSGESLWQRISFIDDKYVLIDNKKYLKSFVKFL